MTPNLHEILQTSARNRLGCMYDRYGSDFPADQYLKLVSRFDIDCGAMDEWIDYAISSMKILEDGYAMYKVFK